MACVPAGPGEGVLPRIDGFDIERELGRGTTGVVYLARREAPRRYVALKLWPGGRHAGEKERRKWLREAEAVAAVRHPNVVTLHEALVTDDSFLLVLEYVSGGTLADRLAGPIAARSAARIVETVARAVHHIHASGLLHLDLKPSNILLDGEAQAELDALVPKVSDFGIARSVEAAVTDTGGAGAGGTPSYMAPEQISRSRGDMTAAADIHGLGAILYHALTGRPPYQAATVLETIDQLRRVEPIPPRRFSRAIPRDLETICLKCLHKEPSRRYSTAEALAEDLSRWLDGRAISARPVSAAEKSWRWCRRRPAIAALSAALVLTSIIGLTAVVNQWRRAEANFRASIELAGELVNMAIGTENWYPKWNTLDGRIQLFERYRTRLLSLASSRPDDLDLAELLSQVEVGLAHELMRIGKHRQAQTILLESVDRGEAFLSRHPAELRVLEAISAPFYNLASASEHLGDLERSVACHKRMVELYEHRLRTAMTPEALLLVIEGRRHLAWVLYSTGNLADARSLIRDNERAFGSRPPAVEDRRVTRLRVLCRIDSLEFALPGASVASAAGKNITADSLPLSRLASLKDDDQSPAEWAGLVAEALGCADSAASTSARADTDNALYFMGQLIAIDSRLRGSHEVDRAQRLAARMLALADHLVKVRPQEPASHLARSIAYAQIYKNAYEAKDHNAIEPNLRAAHDAAQEALLLDPASDRARHAVDDLGRRLADLPSGR
jgi:serine/threonine protein kinase